MDFKAVGFIGTGVMGKSMCRHLMSGGSDLFVYTRTKQKADDLIKEGAKWCDTAADLAAKCDVVITMVGYPQDVEEVYLGPQGILDNIRKGSYIVDMTTSDPLLSEKLYAEAEKRGVFALDAPVSGGDVGAREGNLAIMAGGDEKAFNDLLPLFQLMGGNIRLLGGAGAGQYTKMANQIAIASTMMGVCEALTYANKAGLDQESVLKTIETGAAGSFTLSKLGPRMIKGDFKPGFYIKHFIKDLDIAIESADKMGMKTPGLVLAKKLYQELAEAGNGNDGTQALYKYYRDE